MSAEGIVTGTAALYLLLCLTFGMAPGKKISATATGYVAGDRTLGLFLMYFIMGASIFSAFAFLGAPGWAYSRGAAGFYILGYGALGFMPFYFLGPRAARLGRKYGFVTQAEMVAARFSLPPVAGVMALISVVAFVPYLALQMKGAGYVLATITDETVPEWAGAALVYGIVLLYVWHSGVLGVGWTNAFQGMSMLALAWGLGLYLPYKLYGGVGEMFTRIASERPELLHPPGLAEGGSAWSWGEYTSAVLVSIIGFCAWPHLFMKAFTAKSDAVIKRTVLLYPTFQIFLVPLFLIGFAGVMFHSAPEQADRILPHILMNIEISPVLVGLFCAGALAASMSSGDAMAHAAASVAVRDGMVTSFKMKMGPRRQQTVIRYFLLVILVGSYAVAILYRGSLVNLLLSAYGAVVQFFPVLLATLYWRRATGAGVLAGMLSGALVTLLFVLQPGWRPWEIHAGAYGVAVNVVLLFTVSMLTGKRPSEEEEAYLETARSG